jgi:hypothetical protein
LNKSLSPEKIGEIEFLVRLFCGFSISPYFLNVPGKEEVRLPDDCNRKAFQGLRDPDGREGFCKITGLKKSTLQLHARIFSFSSILSTILRTKSRCEGVA